MEVIVVSRTWAACLSGEYVSTYMLEHRHDASRTPWAGGHPALAVEDSNRTHLRCLAASCYAPSLGRAEQVSAETRSASGTGSATSGIL